MPKPYEFKSRQELIDQLKNAKTNDAARKFFSNPSPSVSDVVLTGVRGNTFRAFRNLPTSPSKTFRTWAENHIQHTLDKLKNLVSETDYAAYVHTATLSLENEWRKTTKSEMGYGRGAKLFNLVLKRFACFDDLSADQKDRLISLQHVPLDSYTIVGLRLIAPNLCIPKSATMSYIETQKQYEAFQKTIFDIASEAGVPAIHYDILAWDMGH